MRRISQRVKNEILNDPFYRICARAKLLHDHKCEGRLSFEHTLTFAGRQVDEVFAIIPLCDLAHGIGQFLNSGGILNKQINEWIALNRATDAELEKYSRADWKWKKDYLNKIYGIPDFSVYPQVNVFFPV